MAGTACSSQKVLLKGDASGRDSCRPAAVIADQIRATVLAMLAEAGDAEPASGARFRQIERWPRKIGQRDKWNRSGGAARGGEFRAYA